MAELTPDMVELLPEEVREALWERIRRDFPAPAKALLELVSEQLGRAPNEDEVNGFVVFLYTDPRIASPAYPKDSFIPRNPADAVSDTFENWAEEKLRSKR